MKTLTFNQAKQIPIVEYLDKLGIVPAKIRGNDHWYYSPFRDERSPSFKVDARLNLWYDHGAGEGGSIVDLGAKLHECSLSEFLDKLANENFSFTGKKFETPVEKASNKLEVLKVEDLTDPGLIQYLRERGIEVSIACRYCREVDFRIGTNTHRAIGFPTRSGSFELRNRWFKGSSSPKDISVIKSHDERVCVLEGFVDFLSIQQLNDKDLSRFTNSSSFVILNSLSLLTKNLPLIQSYREINLFLDNDNAGRETKELLKAKGVRFNDASPIYSAFKDVNELLMKSTKERSITHRQKRFRI